MQRHNTNEIEQKEGSVACHLKFYLKNPTRFIPFYSVLLPNKLWIITGCDSNICKVLDSTSYETLYNITASSTISHLWVIPKDRDGIKIVLSTMKNSLESYYVTKNKCVIEPLEEKNLSDQHKVSAKENFIDGFSEKNQGLIKKALHPYLNTHPIIGAIAMNRYVIACTKFQNQFKLFFFNESEELIETGGFLKSNARIVSVAASTDKNKFFLGDYDGNIQLWDIHTRKCLATQQASSYLLGPLHVIDDRVLYLAQGSEMGAVQFFDFDQQDEQMPRVGLFKKKQQQPLVSKENTSTKLCFIL